MIRWRLMHQSPWRSETAALATVRSVSKRELAYKKVPGRDIATKALPYIK